MNKAILVIDMPDYCSECIMCRENDFCHEMCIVANERIFTSEKPDWCPLKPVPEEQEIWFDDERSDWERGYNNCLREIVGRE